MASGLINKYIWLLDTILRHKSITRKYINELWVDNASLSDGVPLPRRTFHSYCRRIEEIFDVTIHCNQSTFEYSIETDDADQNYKLCDWLLDSVSINGTLSNSREIASRIMLENVPSSREYLPVIIDGIKENKRIRFKYCAFDRSRSSEVSINPYYIRIFRQRWYVIGLNKETNDIRTYALDRVSDIQLLTTKFEAPAIEVSEFFKDSFGIYKDKNDPVKIRLKVKAEQAKYFRALPLHHSQTEEIHDKYSIFSYYMLTTYDLVQEIISHGANIEVLEPAILRTKVITALQDTLNVYK